MNRSVIRPVRSASAKWNFFWWMCLGSLLMAGCVQAVAGPMELTVLSRCLLWLSGAAVAAAFWFRNRNRLLLLAPWVLLAAALLVGNPIRGGGSWLDGMLLRWNQAHNDGLRLIGAVSTEGDRLAFCLWLMALFGLGCGVVVRRKSVLACLGLSALVLCLCVLGQCLTNVVCVLVAGVLLGILVTGPEGQANHRGCVLWTIVTGVLLVPALLLPGEFAGYDAWRADLTEKIETLRYGKQLLPQGDLYRSDELKAGEGVVLEVTSEQQKNLYFASFLGSVYEDGAWQALPKSSYGGENTGLLRWLKKQNFVPQTQLAQYARLAEGETETNHLAVRVLSGRRDVLYVPASLETVIRKGSVSHDGLVLSRGPFGQQTYTLAERSGSKPGELSVPAEWVMDPQTAEEAAYVQAESAYRDFVYGEYTQVDQGLAEAIERVFHQEEPQSDSVFGVLTLVRQVLRTNESVDETARTPEGADPIDYFLTRSHRGGEMLFASAAVEALRSYGIPARYAEGYYMASSSLDADGVAQLTGANAHAWVEVYFDGIGWQSLDVVPGYYYDLVSLQEMVSLPDDISRTSAVVKNEDGLEGFGDSGETGPREEKPEPTASVGIVWLLPILGCALGIGVIGLLIGEWVRFCMERILRRRWDRMSPAARAELAKEILYRFLSAWDIQASLGWKTKDVDALVAERCPKARPGDYTRVCNLLEKSIYGEVPPEVYEERTIKAFLKRISKPGPKTKLRARLHARYCWVDLV